MMDSNAFGNRVWANSRAAERVGVVAWRLPRERASGVWTRWNPGEDAFLGRFGGSASAGGWGVPGEGGGARRGGARGRGAGEWECVEDSLRGEDAFLWRSGGKRSGEGPGKVFGKDRSVGWWVMVGSDNSIKEKGKE
jgi:hypothetical protein